MPEFTHLHCHSQFSLLDGAASIEGMFKKAKKDGMKGLAITDHGNMFGAFQFVAEASKHEGVKPIVGCEFYVVSDRHRKTFTKDDRDKRFHQLFLAKNAEGYKNLTKLCSLGFIEGMYSKYPRIDKSLILKYHEGLIATTCCLGALVPQMILRHGEKAARKEFEWWLDLFGEDYYIELQRHQMPDQDKVNEVLVRWSKEYNVKMIASNDSHYVDQKDSNAHDILLCINTGEKQATPKTKEFSDDSQSARGTRFAFWNDQFYFKTQAEMNALFSDIPEAIDNTGEILGKIEPLKLKKDILLPNFEVPTEFASQDDYLRDLTFKGAKERYKNISPEVEERLNFELNTIKIMGFAGYFLIVADFIKAGREIGVLIGPGRGSAAGSAVAYCTGITNIDPIKYSLLFERFLNPDRKSMPDIDTDFDDEGRQKVIDYVVKKYGDRQVAQIVTYGTMAAKMSIKDVSRVLDLPLDRANGLAKLVSDKPGISLKRLLMAPIDGEGSLREKENLSTEDIENAKKLREFFVDMNNLEEGNVLREAAILEGSVRGTGVHAAGIIIAPYDLTDILPVAVAKDSNLLLTQFEGSIIEDAGVIKMDFLGLKTLTIIRDALRLIKQNYGLDIEIDSIPLDDQKTYQLYQRGDTNGTFQFESAGMQKYLRDLKPDKFEDLIAMNALYRPGPIEYIPLFINRKHGREAVVYDLPEMEELLKETYGICLTGDTLIHDPVTGERHRIDSLEKSVGKRWVQGVDAHNRTQNRLISNWVCNGEKRVFQVKLRNGSTVKMTNNHQVLTESGWKMLSELAVGDFIATPRQLFAAETNDFDRGKLRVLAYLLADGALSGHANTAEFTSKSSNLIDAYKIGLQSFERIEPRSILQVREVTRVMVAGVNKIHYHETNSLVKSLRDWGLKYEKTGCRSQEKFVPEFVFGLSNDCIAFFLACIWDCDGCLDNQMGSIKTISPKLAHDFQTLLLRLGIHSTIYESEYFSNRRQSMTTAFQISVYDLPLFKKTIAPHLLLKQFSSEKLTETTSKDSVHRAVFFEEIKNVWSGSQRNLMETHGFSRQHFNSLNKNRPRIAANVAADLAEKLPLPTTSRNLHLRWEEIVEIEFLGNELVFDISVEDIHNFVGNNIILHNCTFQEQIMLLSQKIANFSKGDADVLRKAMGKKQKSVLDKMKDQFISGGAVNHHPADKLEKIWTDWEAFASYAFNKSHSTCYALVAYQTAWLKTHYPSEFMAATLTHSQSQIEKIFFFLTECKSMGLNVKGPDVNESLTNFSVNKKGEIRYGLGAIKGVGEAAVDALIVERTKNGPFLNIFDFMRRQNLRTVNKRVMESLVMGGAFDDFGLDRSVFFAPTDKYETFIEQLIKYGSGYQEEKTMSVNSLFGDLSDTVAVPEPAPPKAEPWSLIFKLAKEKDVCGLYLSGHPLDDYLFEWQNFCTPIDKIENFKARKISIGGFVSKTEHRISQKGTGWGKFTIQDYSGSHEIVLFTENYQRFKNLLEEGTCVFATGNYQQRFNGDEWELKLADVRQLATIGAEKTESVTVKINLAALNLQLLADIELICKNHKGRHKFRIELLDFDTRSTLSMTSGDRKVNMDNDFAAALKGLGLDFSVN